MGPSATSAITLLADPAAGTGGITAGRGGVAAGGGKGGVAAGGGGGGGGVGGGVFPLPCPFPFPEASFELGVGEVQYGQAYERSSQCN